MRVLARRMLRCHLACRRGPDRVRPRAQLMDDSAVAARETSTRCACRRTRRFLEPLAHELRARAVVMDAAWTASMCSVAHDPGPPPASRAAAAGLTCVHCGADRLDGAQPPEHP